MDKIALIIAGGLGESVTYVPKLPHLLNEQGVEKVDFYVINTFPTVTPIIVEFLESSPLIDEIFVNFYPDTKKYKKVIDWRPDDAPLKYVTDKNFQAPTTNHSEHIADMLLYNVDNPISIFPYTLGGNERSLHEKYARSPKEEWWIGLFDKIIDKGFTPIIIGGELEIIDWKKDGIKTCYTDDIFTTISVILRCNGHIGIGAWPYMIAHYSNKMNVAVLQLHNHHWKDRHLAEDRSKFKMFLEIPTYEEIISSIEILK